MDNPRSSLPPEAGGDDKNKKTRNKTKDKSGKKKLTISWGWTVKVFLASITISAVLTLLSSEMMNGLSIIVAFIILFFFIFINIFFDVIGLAVTTAEEKPFHSMASRKIKAGAKAVSLIHNAEKVSNFCSDVIGDIAGVLSGSTGAAIVIKLFTSEQTEFWGNLLVTSLISGFTVGGKAIGKALGIRYNQEIVYASSRFLCLFSRRRDNDKDKKNKPK